MAAEFPPNGLDPTNPSGGTIGLGAGVQRIDGTDYPLFEGGDEEAGGGAYLNGGVIKAKLATGSVVNGSNEVTADLASPASAELSANKWRALLDPATSAVNTRGASGVVTSFTAYTRINGSSIDVKASLLHKVDLTAPLATPLDSNSVNPTIAAQGNGYRITLTTQATARDGADEGWRGRFALKDRAGNAVDLTSGAWVVIVEVRRIASTVGAQITVSAGLSTRATTTGGQHALGGYCTGLGTLQRNIVTSTSTNGTSNDAALDTVRMVFMTVRNGSTFQLPAGVLSVHSSADALNSETQFTSQSDASPGTVGLSVLIGTDGTTAGLTDSTDVEIYAVAEQIVALGA